MSDDNNRGYFLPSYLPSCGLKKNRNISSNKRRTIKNVSHDNKRNNSPFFSAFLVMVYRETVTINNTSDNDEIVCALPFYLPANGLRNSKTDFNSRQPVNFHE